MNHLKPPFTYTTTPPESRVLKLHVGQVHEILVDHFGRRQNLKNKSDPLDELFFIMLSGQTSEALYDTAFESLKAAFPNWNLLLRAKVTRIERAIQNAGLATQKSVYIQSIARRLQDDFGDVSLKSLSCLSNSDAETYLCSLPGVGIKTARCVLMYSLKRKVFPADVHCLRVMTRLGWIRWKGGRAEKFAEVTQNLVPPRLRFRLHVNMVLLGRSTCRIKPQCGQCKLLPVCPTGTRATQANREASV